MKGGGRGREGWRAVWACFLWGEGSQQLNLGVEEPSGHSLFHEVICALGTLGLRFTSWHSASLCHHCMHACGGTAHVTGG